MRRMVVRELLGVLREVQEIQARIPSAQRLDKTGVGAAAHVPQSPHRLDRTAQRKHACVMLRYRDESATTTAANAHRCRETGIHAGIKPPKQVIANVKLPFI